MLASESQGHPSAADECGAFEYEILNTGTSPVELISGSGFNLVKITGLPPYPESRQSIDYAFRLKEFPGVKQERYDETKESSQPPLEFLIKERERICLQFKTEKKSLEVTYTYERKP